MNLGEETEATLSGEVINIELYPDTGYHLFFIPVKDELCSEKFKTFCVEEKTPWRLIDKREKYIKVKPSFTSRNGEEIFGFLVAIETNTGNASRGTFYDERIFSEEKDENLNSDYPYKYRDDMEFKNGTPEVKKIIFDNNVLVSFMVTFLDPHGGSSCVECDLVVDLGNSRTVAMLVERPAVNRNEPYPALERMMMPLDISGMNHVVRYFGDVDRIHHSQDMSIAESWVVLHETLFPDDPDSKELITKPIIAKREYGLIFKKTKLVKVGEKRLVPQFFSDNSPIYIGEQANNELGNISSISLNRKSGALRYFMSSPKRYSWDCYKFRDGEWAQILNKWNRSGEKMLGALKGNALRFLREDGQVWDISKPPNKLGPLERPCWTPTAPQNARCDILTLTALKIIESAYYQMHNRQWQRSTMRHVLKNINVTFPSGWTPQEVKSYKDQWQKAINIFVLNNLKPGSEIPNLMFEVDEALAAQLPIVYNEIKALGNEGDNWIKLLGKKRENDEYSVRIMSIDIGGGTLDTSIVQYVDEYQGEGVSLRPTLLFKNSETNAGDSILKDIIEKILLPKICRERATGYESQCREFWSFRNTWDDVRATITRRILIPIATYWLSVLSGSPMNRAKVLQTLQDSVAILDSEWQSFTGNPYAPNLIEPDEILDETNTVLSEIENRIKERMSASFSSLAEYARAFDVDIVLLSGKPSEIKCISDLLYDFLPLPSNRIFNVKDMRIGNWYPFRADGKITDAKSVNVVGLALYTLIRGNMIEGWRISSVNNQTAIKNRWGICNPNGTTRVIFGESNELESDFIVVQNLNRIGRAFFKDDQYSPVYRINIEGGEGRVEVKFRRNEDSTYLEIAEVRSSGDLPNVKMELCMLPIDSDKGFWMDEPSFVVEMEEE